MLLAGHVDDPLCGMCFGIIYIREATPTIRNSRIASSPNTGIAIYESAVCIEDNVLSNNSAGASGGGAILVDCYREAPRIVRNTFEGSVRPRLGRHLHYRDSRARPDSSMCGDGYRYWECVPQQCSDAIRGGAIFVEFAGTLRLDSPDSNTHVGNEPDDVLHVAPPTP